MITLCKVHYFDEHSSLMKGKHLDEKSTLWGNSMAFMKSPNFGENSVKISEMKYIIVIKNENMSLWSKKLSSWPQIYHFGYLGSIYKCDQLYFSSPI